MTDVICTAYICLPIVFNFFLYSHFRPRLGVTLHKVVVAGALYLLFSGMEGVLRVTGVSNHLLQFHTSHIQTLASS